MPGPPGSLGAVIWLWQQTSPSEQVPSTPAVQGQPIPSQVGVAQWPSAPQYPEQHDLQKVLDEQGLGQGFVVDWH